MRFGHRLAKLEAARGGDKLGLLVVLFDLYSPDGETEPHIAWIGAGPYGEFAQLNREEGETEQAFMARTNAEVLRIHGRLPLQHGPFRLPG